MSNLKKFGTELLFETKYVANSLTNYIGSMIIWLLPYVTLVVGIALCKSDIFSVLSDFYWILPIPIIVLFIARYLKWYADTIGKGDSCPKPIERFTEVDDNGMISVEHNRMQELILYVADVEDYLERKGIL